MFVREVGNQLRRNEPPNAAQQKIPFVAAVKRGPYTMTSPVYDSAQLANNSAKMHNHTFNINMTALKDNHKYHARTLRPPLCMASKLTKSKSRSHLFVNEKRVLYKQHRDRLANIKGKVNTCLPAPKIKITEGNSMELSYMEMLASLYRKSNNTLRTFTKAPDRLAAGRWRNVSVAREKDRKQQELNKKYHPGGRLFDPNVGKSQSNQSRVGRTFSYDVPNHVLHRYEKLMDICDASILCKMLRPQVYMDVEVLGTSILGRLTIQLFTEACPQVVLEFIRVCTHQNTNSIQFTRTFAPIWLEGRIALSPEHAIDMSNIEHDFEVLNHGVDAGILSFPCRYVRASHRKSLNFTISFKPLSILNGKRIAFGKIRKGLQLLERIQDATQHLSNHHEVVVLKDCGIL